jgi:hypothetical protein
MSKRPSLAESMRQAVSAPEPTPVAAPPAPVAVPTPIAAPVPPPATEKQLGFYAATRVGKKKVTATLAPTDHKRLRQLALERDATTEALLNEAISDLFAKYGKAAIGKGTGAV